ncbi:MAG: hypothetical protein KDH89_15495, partial [Anaerolineae bacterium]|nr:hypothetical protein [Anaerolineae bacterium]
HGQNGLYGPTVKVIEIHKLAETASRDGVSVVLEEIGSNNLVIVDEGHKGTGSEAQVWKNRQKYLSERGFLLEYSATFAQAIAAAGRRSQQDLLQEYGQAILFDYSYAHFYHDGYGKDFAVLNLQDERPDQAHELLAGALLVFYHQRFLYRQYELAYRPFNIEMPLWVLLGSSVNALYTQSRQRRSDVAEVVAFLKRFVEDRDWSLSVLGRILQSESGFRDAGSGQDLFAPHMPGLLGKDPAEVYQTILADLFHGSGGLEVWELKQADGELGLRLSTADEAAPYFGVINIGDSSAFKKYLAEHVGIETQEDNFRPSQFGQVDAPGSPISLLIGAKKFIEGWSSWRVSSMGLLNVGRGAGSQIIQLFGRGVRLKGKGMSLKRSDALRDGPPPPGISFLETLTIFGWNANYIQTFRQIMDAENLGRAFTLSVQKMTPWPENKLPVPQTKAGFDANQLCWTLDDSGPDVEIDLTARLSVFTSQGQGRQLREQAGERYGTVVVDFRPLADDKPSPYSRMVNQETLYLAALTYKQARGYANLHVTPASVQQVLIQRCRARLSQGDDMPQRLQAVAEQSLCTYLDRFVRMKERDAESKNAEPSYLTAADPRVLSAYQIRVTSDSLAAQIEQLLQGNLDSDAGESLPRLHVDRSLYNPLLTEGGTEWRKQVSLHPPGLNVDERQFIIDIRKFWADNHTLPPWRDQELHILRNTARTGIGLFNRSGFYPDFLLWLSSTDTGTVRVIFVDPHGLHHGGLAGNADKFAALDALRALSNQPEFREKKIRLNGFLLTTTPVDKIVDAEMRSEAELERTYPLLFQRGDYARKLLQTTDADQ